MLLSNPSFEPSAFESSAATVVGMAPLPTLFGSLAPQNSRFATRAVPQ